MLPFENLSLEPDNSFFADGVQDEILTDLARIADLKVIGRTSVLQYKSGVARDLRKIGEQLGVAHLVEGTVQRSGNRLRVNAQLVDARTDRTVHGGRSTTAILQTYSQLKMKSQQRLPGNSMRNSRQMKRAKSNVPQRAISLRSISTRARTIFF